MCSTSGESAPLVLSREVRDSRILRLFAEGESVASIARAAGVSAKTVRNVCSRNGVAGRRADNTNRNRRVVDRYRRGEPIREIATAEGVAPSYVRPLARRSGLAPRVGWQRRYPLDERAFDEPTSTGLWLIGLLASDGSINGNDHRVSLCQRAADADVLHAFLEYVGSPSRPLIDLESSPAAAARQWPRTPAQEARIYSSRICTVLAQHGIVPRKSADLRLGDVAAAEPAVWLGMLDGDGSVSVIANRSPRLNWFGTPPVMEQCARFWSDRLRGSDKRPIAVNAHAGGLGRVSLNGFEAASAARLMLSASAVSQRRKRALLMSVSHYQPPDRSRPVHRPTGGA